MTSHRRSFLGFTGLVMVGGLSALTASAATRYVWQSSPSPEPPHDTWATAAHNIQDAVDVAEPGDSVLVIGGVYDTGGRAMGGIITTRLTVDKAVTVQSLMGPEVTVIAGAPAAGGGSGDGAVRCVYLGDGAVLSGFTLSNGHTLTNAEYFQDQTGGGISCEGLDVVTNCIISGNSAYWGGGVYGGTLYSCTVRSNSALADGGGTYYGELHHCTLTGNRAAGAGGGAAGSQIYNCVLTGNEAQQGGGAVWGTLYSSIVTGNAADIGGGIYSCGLYNCTVTGNSAAQYGGGTTYAAAYNSLIYHNNARVNPNYQGGDFNYSCTTPLPASGTGNIAEEPQLASASHLSATSPCLGAGSDGYAFGIDIDGEPWLSPPCIGADQVVPGGAISSLSVAIESDYATVAKDFAVSFRGLVEGQTTRSYWDFADGTTLTNRPLELSHAWKGVGTYGVRLTAYNDAFPGGVSATVMVQVVEVPVSYVNQANLNPVFPYQTWETAATNIQDAIGANEVAGRLIWVTNGIYDLGGAVAVGSLLTNRVALTNAVRVQSVNGPLLTIIHGAAAPGGTNGDGAVRCAFVGRKSILSGFTLTNGHTRLSGDTGLEQSGAGVWAEGGIVTNCILTGNWANRDGGGADGAVLYNCIVAGNRADDDSGGADDCTLYDCTIRNNTAFQNAGAADSSILHRCLLAGNSAGYGGGVDDSTLFNCVLTDNTSSSDAGAAGESVLHNCVLTGNAAAQDGGGADACTLFNCTVTGNAAAERGGGTSGGTLYNCIVYHNTARLGSNYRYGFFEYSCTTPLPENGVGNLADEPLLASASHLSAASPCIGAGAEGYASGVDIDGEPWLSPPCMGADQIVAGGAVSPLFVAIEADYTEVTRGFGVSFRGQIEGQTTSSQWDLADGTVVRNQPFDVSHAWSEVGVYSVRLTAYNDAFPSGVSATVTVRVVEVPVHYVNAANANPAFPFLTWETAATNIQDAIAAGQVAGREVWVTNGVYDLGGVALPGSLLTNRVALTNAVTVRSVNGPLVTFIQGMGGPGNAIGEGAVRCAYLGKGSVLSGFTLTNGHTLAVGAPTRESAGGAAWCEANAVLTNCLITGNAAYFGGGVYAGVLYNCTLTSNSASWGGGGAVHLGTLYDCTLLGNSTTANGGGANGSILYGCLLTQNTASDGAGANESTLHNCVLAGNRAPSDGGGANESMLYDCTLRSNTARRGAGAYSSTLHRCTLADNRASHDGGGADRSRLYNCLLTGNRASDDGGGVDESSLYNCTVVGNSAVDSGGGTSESGLFNCIVYYNTASVSSNSGAYWSIFHSCTLPIPFSGSGNFTNEPAFLNRAAGDFHLRYGSPCIDAGTNLSDSITTDLDGHPRPLDGNWDGTAAFDVGAFEYDPQTADSSSDGIPDYWCCQYGFDPNDPSVATQNPDQDAFSNLDEWVADTDPTNAQSLFRILAISNLPPVTVYFLSSSNRLYSLLFSTDLASLAWGDLPGQVNIPGEGTLQGLVDTNAVGARFYRVQVTVP